MTFLPTEIDYPGPHDVLGLREFIFNIDVYWQVQLLSVLLPMASCVIFILLIRWNATPLLWLCIILSHLLLIYGIFHF